MSPVAKTSKWMARLCVLVALLLPLFVLAAWFSYLWQTGGEVAAQAPYPVGRLAAISAAQRMLGVAVSLAPALILIYGLLRLRQTFLEAHYGRYFSDRAVRGFRMFAWMVFANVPLRIISAALASVILSWDLPPGQRQLSVTFGAPELINLFLAFLFVALAHIWAEGRKYAEDSAQII